MGKLNTPVNTTDEGGIHNNLDVDPFVESNTNRVKGLIENGLVDNKVLDVLNLLNKGEADPNQLDTDLVNNLYEEGFAIVKVIQNDEAIAFGIEPRKQSGCKKSKEYYSLLKNGALILGLE